MSVIRRVIPALIPGAAPSTVVSIVGGGFNADVVVVVVVVSPAGTQGDVVEASKHAHRDVRPFALERCGPWFDMVAGFMRDGVDVVCLASSEEALVWFVMKSQLTSMIAHNIATNYD